MGSGYLRYGIYDGVTAEGDVQANKFIAMAGTGALIDTGIGLVNLRAITAELRELMFGRNPT